MTNTTQPGGPSWTARRWASEPFLYLTARRASNGPAYRIEIWFAAHDGRLYLLAGGREQADWVRNLHATPRVVVELGDETMPARHVFLKRGLPKINLPGACWWPSMEGQKRTSTNGDEPPYPS